MYKTILVATDIEDGRRILKELEKQGLQTTAAFWFHKDEEDWKLFVVSPDVEEQGPTKLYTMIARMLKDLSSDPDGPLQFPLDRISLASPSSLIYQTVRRHSGLFFGPVREGYAMDSYIYKMQ
jgi:hypothetical protein